MPLPPRFAAVAADLLGVKLSPAAQVSQSQDVADALALAPSSLPSAIYSNRPPTNIQTAQIANGAVTGAKIATGTIPCVMTGGTMYAAASAQASEYLAVSGGPTLNGADPWTTEAAAANRWPIAGTFDQLRVINKTATPATSVQAFTLRVASADTALTCTIPGGTAINGGATDLVNSVAVAAGDLVAMKKTTTVANGTKDHTWALRFRPTLS